MNGALNSEIEWVVTQMVRRRWATRSAMVSSSGQVLAICTPDSPLSSDFEPDLPTERQPTAERALVARLAVELLDGERWLYVDFGAVRMMARLSRETRADAVVSWLATELRRIGITVERESMAQD
jgi:hypothetical protein